MSDSFMGTSDNPRTYTWPSLPAIIALTPIDDTSCDGGSTPMNTVQVWCMRAWDSA